MLRLLLIVALLIPPIASFFQSPTASAGSDRTALVNETLSLDGTGSTNAFDGLQTNGKHSIQWDFGYGGWTYEGGLTAPVAYPKAGTYTVTLTVCNSGGTCASDTAQVTISAITEGTETVVGDSGNAITNGTNLCNALTTVASSNNPVITITAGITYDFDGVACQLPNRTGTGYTTIRTSAYTSLPNGTTRVFPADVSSMAIITPGDKVGFPAENSAEAAFTAPASATPAHHYRFLGIKFVKKFTTLDYSNPRGFFDIGNASGSFPNELPAATSDLPHHIQIDRCFFDGGDTTHRTTRGVAIAATDSAVVNSYIYRVQGSAVEVQAIWIGQGERIFVCNNYLSATSENMMSGGADVSIRVTQDTAQSTGNDSTHIKLATGASGTNNFYNNMGVALVAGTGSSGSGRVITAYDGTTKIATVTPAWATIPDGTSVYRIGEHVPTDIVVRRNHMQKDICWRSGEGCYYGTDMNVKNIFEIKQGKRWSVEGNRFETHWQEDQNWSITFTVRNQDGDQPWAKLSYIDFSHNRIHKVGNGFQLLTSDYLNPSLTCDRILIRHTVLTGMSFYNGVHNFMDLQEGLTTPTGGDRIYIVRTSNDANGTGGQGRFVAFGSSVNFTNFQAIGNVGQGYFRSDLGFDGEAAIDAATTSYSVIKNGMYLLTGSLPADNSSVATRADVKFTDVANFNLKLAGDSPFLTTGPAGGRSGADTDSVDARTIGTISGIWEGTTQRYRGKHRGRGKVNP